MTVETDDKNATNTVNAKMEESITNHVVKTNKSAVIYAICLNAFLSATYSYHATMEPLYYRLRKGSSVSMRCFPKCCASGHQDSSFCGTSIQASVHIPVKIDKKYFSEVDMHDIIEFYRMHLVLVGEITEFHEHFFIERKIGQADKDVSLRIGSRLSLSELTEDQYVANVTCINIKDGFTNADVVIVVDVEFNQAPRKWTYGREFSRWSSPDNCFLITGCLKQEATANLTCIIEWNSRPFQIACTRKRKEIIARSNDNNNLLERSLQLSSKIAKKSLDESIKRIEYSHERERLV